MTLYLPIAPEIESRLQKAARLAGSTPAAYVEAMLARLLPHETLPQTESVLLKQINEGLSEDEWEQYEMLLQQRDTGVADESDQAQLIQFSDRMEEIAVERLSALIQLAELRNTTVSALKAELMITPRAHE